MYWIWKRLSCRVRTGIVLTGACLPCAIETAISQRSMQAIGLDDKDKGGCALVILCYFGTKHLEVGVLGSLGVNSACGTFFLTDTSFSISWPLERGVRPYL